MGEDAERIDLSGPDLKADPAKLADEAAAISLFGGARMIRIDPIGDESFAAVEALLEAEKAGNPVVAHRWRAARHQQARQTRLW